MFAKSFFASALLATGALAAPTISNSAPAELEKRADWQEGKCENHIFVDVGGNAIAGFDLHWTSSIIDNSGNRIGGFENRKNPLEKDRWTDTSKGPIFYITGQPDGRGSAQDSLTLYYREQIWNSKDCYKYTFVDSYSHESGKDQHNYWCQFDC